ncbi:hypothetical protein F5Y04DRAFT_292951 [Hypomontagnella monticulosa]|nr:hypothetical protein F5Y04DRAFT_292951 [Hypomontagnella monticulosa]
MVDHPDMIVRRKDNPSPAEIGLQDPEACVRACYDRFVEEWLRKTQGTFEDVCYQLSHIQPDTELWKLYRCDSTYCGVWANETGKSPSADLIINKCQNIGNYLIYDPGPPPLDSPSSDPIPNLSSNDLSATMTMMSTSLPAAAETSLSPKLNTTASGVTALPGASTGLTEGSKAAIGICSSLAIITIIFLAGFLINRRRSRPKTLLGNAPNASRSTRLSSGPPSDSHSPLITPPSSASSKGPLHMPPPRLSNRRLLPSLKQGGITDPSLASSVDERPILPAALRSPTETENKFAPWHEPRRPTTNSTPKSPVSPTLPTAVHFARDSANSYSSGPGGASAITISSNKAGSVQNRTVSFSVTHTATLSLPLSPTRPPRPYDTPLDIPPVGPPPTRALPAPPPYHPASPTFTVSPVSPPSSPTWPTGLSTRPAAVVGSGTSKNPFFNRSSSPESKKRPKISGGGTEAVEGENLAADTKDLCELTQSYARETAESWGSWSGAGGGGPGVSFAGGRDRRRGLGHGHGRSRDNGDRDTGDEEKKGEKGRGSGSTVSLKELDLERLGGKY